MPQKRADGDEEFAVSGVAYCSAYGDGPDGRGGEQAGGYVLAQNGAGFRDQIWPAS